MQTTTSYKRLSIYPSALGQRKPPFKDLTQCASYNETFREIVLPKDLKHTTQQKPKEHSAGDPYPPRSLSSCVQRASRSLAQYLQRKPWLKLVSPNPFPARLCPVVFTLLTLCQIQRAG